MHLSSMLVEAARDEDMSALSTDAHDDVVRDMASFMSSTIASYGEKFESEGIYNPELLAVCEWQWLLDRKIGAIVIVLCSPRKMIYSNAPY